MGHEKDKILSMRRLSKTALVQQITKEMTGTPRAKEGSEIPSPHIEIIIHRKLEGGEVLIFYP